MDRAPAHQAPRIKRRHVRILNEHWPLRDAKGNGHARGIRDQPNPVPVRVRVAWDGGAELWIDGTARRWTRDAVFGSFADDRRSTAGVWVRPGDVKRR
jgi:hypothetical protein